LRKIIETIKTAVINYAADNYLKTLWKEPIIKIISANDEKLKILKKAVSTDRLKANDILPDAKSIISFFIPFQDNIVKIIIMTGINVINNVWKTRSITKRQDIRIFVENVLLVYPVH
jgi:epoxyqueuosine reductase QueG